MKVHYRMIITATVLSISCALAQDAAVQNWSTLEQELSTELAATDDGPGVHVRLTETVGFRRLRQAGNVQLYAAMLGQADQPLVALTGFLLLRETCGDCVVEPAMWLLVQQSSPSLLFLDEPVRVLADPQRSEIVGAALSRIAMAPATARPRFQRLMAALPTASVSAAYQRLKGAPGQPDALAAIIGRLYDDGAIGDDLATFQETLRQFSAIPGDPRAFYLSYTQDRDAHFRAVLETFLRDQDTDPFTWAVIANIHLDLLTPQDVERLGLSPERRRVLDELRLNRAELLREPDRRGIDAGGQQNP